MILLAGCVGLCLDLFVGHTAAVVTVFPVPGDRVASPETQIAFRGVSVAEFGKVVVTGSRSGRHAGRLRGDSDGRGGSFLPDRAFAPGEVVTVRTGLHIQGARRGAFRFTVADPAGAVPTSGVAPAPRSAGDVLTFRSRPDLAPVSVEITKPSAASAQGDIFITPQDGPLQNGPMIVAPDGTLVWFDPVPVGDIAADLRVQRYHGKRVLTWWQGYSGAGLGVGEDVIESSSYRRLAVVRAANGLSADLHEFQLTTHGTALITAYYPVYWNLSSIGGPSRAVVLDGVVQEIDVKTGLLLYQWDSLDHVPVSDSYEQLPTTAGHPYDYFHVNSVELDRSGELLISGRNTWAAYEVSARTGRLIWTLGGKRSSFKLGTGASFAFQHDVMLHSRGATTVTVFDDGAGPPAVHQQSRGLTLRLNPEAKTAVVLDSDDHTPPLLASFEGNVQLLKGGDAFVGWGQQPYFTEFGSSGQMLLDGRFVDDNSSYRAYRYPWTATPDTLPAISASAGAQGMTVYASWNGATGVSAWRILSGAKATALHAVSTQHMLGFETQLDAPAAAYVAVEALDARGRVLATSKTVRVS